MGLVATIARDVGFPAHIVHLTSRLAVEEVRAAQSLGSDLSAESCPHYLLFEDRHRPLWDFREGGAAAPFREDVAYLWQALSDGTLTVVASDHAPVHPEGEGRTPST